jgi:hypothetical protein
VYVAMEAQRTRELFEPHPAGMQVRVEGLWIG